LPEGHAMICRQGANAGGHYRTPAEAGAEHAGSSVEV
jgi:hypothetical protein